MIDDSDDDTRAEILASALVNPSSDDDFLPTSRVESNAIAHFPSKQIRRSLSRNPGSLSRARALEVMIERKALFQGCSVKITWVLNKFQLSKFKSLCL